MDDDAIINCWESNIPKMSQSSPDVMKVNVYK